MGVTKLIGDGQVASIVSYSVLNVKALVGTLNQEKALLGVFSVIVQPTSPNNRLQH